MPTFRFDKLIRTKLIETLRSLEVKVHSRTLNSVEYQKALLAKLQEEVEEVVHADSKLELTEELADALEVIFALAHAADISMDHIVQIQEDKRAKKGGFAPEAFVDFIEVNDDQQEMIDYYRARGNKYCENCDCD